MSDEMSACGDPRDWRGMTIPIRVLGPGPGGIKCANLLGLLAALVLVTSIKNARRDRAAGSCAFTDAKRWHPPLSDTSSGGSTRGPHAQPADGAQQSVPLIPGRPDETA